MRLLRQFIDLNIRGKLKLWPLLNVVSDVYFTVFVYINVTAWSQHEYCMF